MNDKLDQLMIAINIYNQNHPVKLDYGSMIANVSFDGYLDIVKYLKNMGGDIRRNNDLPFRLASMNGKLEVVKYLVENGADIHAMNDQALRAAEENGHYDVFTYLKQYI